MKSKYFCIYKSVSYNKLESSTKREMLCVVYKILDEKIKILPTKKVPENVPFIIVLKTNTLIAVLTIKNETEAASFLTRFNFIPLFILLKVSLYLLMKKS